MRERARGLFFMIEGELEATMAGMGQTLGPGTLTSIPARCAARPDLLRTRAHAGF
jgi:hypothetical protein